LSLFIVLFFDLVQKREILDFTLEEKGLAVWAESITRRFSIVSFWRSENSRV